MCDSFHEFGCKNSKADARSKLSRRSLIATGIAAFYSSALSYSAFARTTTQNPADDGLAKRWMARAEEMKRNAIVIGDQPYGAVVVKDEQIIGVGPSRVITDHDATAHAEMVAIRDASKRLGTKDLSGCVLYATSKPCRMCETAAYWAGISRFVYGSGLTDGGAPAYSSC